MCGTERILHQQNCLDIVVFPQIAWLYLRMTSAAAPQNSGTAAFEQPVFLTAPEAADILRVSPWQVVNLCRTGELKATKPGKKWLIRPDDLNAYIAGGSNTEQVSA